MFIYKHFFSSPFIQTLSGKYFLFIALSTIVGCNLKTKEPPSINQSYSDQSSAAISEAELDRQGCHFNFTAGSKNSNPGASGNLIPAGGPNIHCDQRMEPVADYLQLTALLQYRELAKKASGNTSLNKLTKSVLGLKYTTVDHKITYQKMSVTLSLMELSKIPPNDQYEIYNLFWLRLRGIALEHGLFITFKRNPTVNLNDIIANKLEASVSTGTAIELSPLEETITKYKGFESHDPKKRLEMQMIAQSLKELISGESR